MPVELDDTIIAIASAPGGAYRGIVRLSGPSVVACLETTFRADDGADLASIRHPTVISGHVRLSDPLGDVPCDVYFWSNHRSYTRQPAAEIHTIGSPPLLDAMLNAACAAGARLAEPGEFTMRAFLAGRLDLTQAEAVLGVIDAASRNELDTALGQLAGGLATPLNRLRNRLLDLLAHLEAGLDFVEEDIAFISADELQQQIQTARDEAARILEQITQRGEAVTDFRIVLIGWSNVGKSSLLNALTGENAAIVSCREGTTRDYVARRVQWHGLNCLLIDTAGIDLQAANSLGGIAQQMSQQQHQQAHLQLFCVDATRPLNEWERGQLKVDSTNGRLLVRTKIDAVQPGDVADGAIATSSETGEGIEDLRRAIIQRLSQTMQLAATVVGGTAVRCRESLRLAESSLQQAHAIATEELGEELIAAELRNALEELGKVVGAVYTDDILDRIFSRFCIGK